MRSRHEHVQHDSAWLRAPASGPTHLPRSHRGAAGTESRAAARGPLRLRLGLVLATLALLFPAPGLGVSNPSAPPAYTANTAVAGTIRIWGNDQMAALIARWEAGFRKFHPAVRFETKLLGTGTALAGLYCGVADVAFMGRYATPKEIKGFQWVERHPPIPIEVVTGSPDQPGKSPALAVLVSRDNPLSRLTLAQLNAIVVCQPRDGRPRLRTWGQLGLTGDWAGRPIHVYTYDTETGTGLFIQHVVLHDSRKWAWGHVTEFRNRAMPDGSALDAGRQIVAAVAADRYGLGIAPWSGKGSRVHAVALAAHADGPWLRVTAKDLIRQTYPLGRVLPAYINRTPGRPVDPPVREFLRYILSRQGQEIVSHEGDYLPLSTAAIRRERAQLD